ncbi:2,3-bisphosphoglycerate-independent phosphoglycerate mutase [Rhodohalobacter mucosus]|uniref:2,3-bisphosphoglycerate-independent phosphoglycerate mutase n=1 Tax=Rhodohalobacter mucosus TaxID=2079485 RepID=A0A316TNL5_9BACT|nr:2,3-bisphosphoglycerate-independent phosphoglycerate mutase [Rhodohalobacter mucosus]PWN06187.1 2,3-bisphosphoglycerate-independent phosphoglycerate mutase [Rhodohalobacter mucosus]
MANTTKKALLVILDGFGIADNPDVSAVDKADKPFYDSLINNYPNSKLSASGESVGLPEGQFGNSEVGHLNIGAGRIVWQELSRINKSIRDGDFFENSVLTKAFEKASSRNRVHIMGLFSDGGVHSHNNHLFALLEMAHHFGIEHTFVHAFTDGRDTSPHGGAEYARQFEEKAEEIGTGTLASIVGRYYAMDRDNRWERTRKAYELLLDGKGAVYNSAEKVFSESYNDDITDEFILPHRIKTTENSRIRKGDVVIFYNIRGDRARQITKALFQNEDVPFETRPLDLHYVTFTSYDDTFNSFAEVAFPPVRLKNTLGEVVSAHRLKQLRIAETEKYPHVTYFFNGGEEIPNPGEDRIMVPSPKVATYDLKPEMSAEEVTNRLCEELEKETYSLAVLNFANPDMVGHTGVMEAAIKAVETVDHQLKRVVNTATEHGYQVLIIADHGNADCLVQKDGSPHTAHTTAPVPVILVGEDKSVDLTQGILADVAPTLLHMMNIEKPEEMTGSSLF